MPSRTVLSGPKKESRPTILGYSVCLADTDPQCNATESFGVRAESIVEEGKFTLADAYLKKKPAADIELDFGERFEGRLTLLPGNRVSVQFR
jgi:chromosome partitioning protein